MAVAIRIVGAARKFDHGDDEMMLKLAERITIKNKPIKMIQLKLADGVVRGNGGYQCRGFQTLTASVDQNGGGISASLSVDAEGNPAAGFKVSFSPDGFGGKFAYVVDTAYNRELLVNTFKTDPSKTKWIVLDSDIYAEVEKRGTARHGRKNDAIERSFDRAEKLVHDRKKLLIKGLQDRIGAGYRETSEYREEVLSDVKKLARKFFVDDKSWHKEPVKKAPAKKATPPKEDA